MNKFLDKNGLSTLVDNIKVKPGEGTNSFVQKGAELIEESYGPNLAYSQNGSALGEGCISGTKAYRIEAASVNDDGSGYYVVDRTGLPTYETEYVDLGINVGDILSVYLKDSMEDLCTVTAIGDYGQLVAVDICKDPVTNNSNLTNEEKAEYFAKSWLRVSNRPSLQSDTQKNNNLGQPIPTIGNITIGTASHAEGGGSMALGVYSHAEGQKCIANGKYSHAEGRLTFANYAAHSEGRYTYAKGEMSHAEGAQTQAIGNCSHAQGSNTKAIGNSSFSTGDNNTAAGNFSSVFGQNSSTSEEARYSMASGYDVHAQYPSSHAFGRQLDTNTPYQTVVGTNNASSEGLFVVGVGDLDGTPINGLVVNKNGTVSIHSSGTDHKNVVHYGQLTSYVNNYVTWANLANKPLIYPNGTNIYQTSSAGPSGSYNASFNSSNSGGTVTGEYNFTCNRSMNYIAGTGNFAAGLAHDIGTSATTCAALGQGNTLNHWLSTAIGYQLKSDANTQVILGKYNATGTAAPLVVGVGTSDSNRKNGLIVRADGRVTVGSNGISSLDVATIGQLSSTSDHMLSDIFFTNSCGFGFDKHIMDGFYRITVTLLAEGYRTGYGEIFEAVQKRYLTSTYLMFIDNYSTYCRSTESEGSYFTYNTTTNKMFFYPRSKAKWEEQGFNFDDVPTDFTLKYMFNLERISPYVNSASLPSTGYAEITTY